MMHAILVIVAVYAQMVVNEQIFNLRTYAILIVFAVGAFLGGATTYVIVSWLGRRLQWSSRFALVFVALTVCSLAAIGFIHFLQFRRYPSEFHAEMFSRLWMWQTLATGISSVGLFLVIGLRLLLPIGLISVFVSSMICLRMTRRV